MVAVGAQYFASDGSLAPWADLIGRAGYTLSFVNGLRRCTSHDECAPHCRPDNDQRPAVRCCADAGTPTQRALAAQATPTSVTAAGAWAGFRGGRTASSASLLPPNSRSKSVELADRAEPIIAYTRSTYSALLAQPSSTALVQTSLVQERALPAEPLCGETAPDGYTVSVVLPLNRCAPRP